MNRRAKQLYSTMVSKSLQCQKDGNNPMAFYMRAEDLKIGMPMEIVFRDEREGNILDIHYFRPIKE